MAADTLRVLNPQGFPPHIDQARMAPRLGTLEGKTVYLVDCRFDDSDLFMDQMAAWFARNMPAVQTVRRSKAGTHSDKDPGLFREIAERGDAMVLGVGH